jgi:hypothetical protein
MNRRQFTRAIGIGAAALVAPVAVVKVVTRSPINNVCWKPCHPSREGCRYAMNPVKALCDLARQTGWTLDEAQRKSLHVLALYCDEPVSISAQG